MEQAVPAACAVGVETASMRRVVCLLAYAYVMLHGLFKCSPLVAQAHCTGSTLRATICATLWHS